MTETESNQEKNGVTTQEASKEKKDGNYNYCFGRPVIYYSVTESEQDLESESSKVIREML